MAQSSGFCCAWMNLQEFAHKMSTQTTCEIGERLIGAAEKGHVQLVDLLIQSGADVNLVSCDGQTALTQAAKYGHTECVALLVKSGADVNFVPFGGFSALVATIMCSQNTCYELLSQVRAKATISKHLTSKSKSAVYQALLRAAEFRQQSELTQLLEAGADVNLWDAKGNTVLITVAGSKRMKNLDCVVFMLKHGACISKYNDVGHNAFRYILSQASDGPETRRGEQDLGGSLFPRPRRTSGRSKRPGPPPPSINLSRQVFSKGTNVVIPGS